MSKMIESITDFLRRHKRKFFVTGAVFGGLYFLTSYVQRKLREWQENEAQKFFEMTRKKQHFESTERTCNQTILSLSKIVTDNILGLLNTEEIVQKLKENPENKLALWEQLKIMIFTRICVLIYALSILQVTLRVQLNIIGGYLYKDSVHKENPFVDSDLQAKYLSLCHHFVGTGVEDLITQTEAVVRRVVESTPLNKKITLGDVEQMFWSIQTIVCTDKNGDPTRKMATYLVGPTEITNPKLDTIVKETMDILESDEIKAIAMSCISRNFSSVIDEIANLFVSKSAPTSKNHLELNVEHVVTAGAKQLAPSVKDFVDVNKVELHFVKLLPVMNDLITKNTCKGNTNIPDLLLQQLTMFDKLKLMGANIYEVFSSA